MSKRQIQISGNIVDLFGKKIFPGRVLVKDGIIESITETIVADDVFILPGFVDAHVHIESSMLVPSEFARAAVRHGTVAAVCDPHEIANVCGMDGVRFMIENGKKVPFLFHFGAPSCVPATTFESSGSNIDVKDVAKLLESEDVYFLAEMMNFPGAVQGDLSVMKKIDAAKKSGKPIDGHAPGLSGDDLIKYISRGITTDHECMTINEAVEKIHAGMKILIREGSAARNLNELMPLIKVYPNEIMFCTDDSHPDTLIHRHINFIVKEAVSKGYNIFDVLRAASLNPVSHYKLNVGLLRKGDKADFIVVDNLKQMNVLKTIINGELVLDNGKVKFPETEIREIPNNFSAGKIELVNLEVESKSDKIRVIEMLDGELYTKSIICEALVENGKVIADVKNDILKLVVLNRYSKKLPQVGFIKGFGLKYGALAGSIAHDSHNIIAVGTNDADLVAAINLVVENKGGLVVTQKNDSFVLPLPVGGLMSNQDAGSVAEKYKHLESLAHNMGSPLRAPFMALSFLSLLVIPELKLGDKGLFDVNKFEFTSLFV